MKSAAKRVLSFLYHTKWYFDRGISQVSWFVGKLPELMAIIYLAEKIGYLIPGAASPPLVLFAAAGLIILGVLYKHTGFYDTERYVDTKKDPIMDVVFRAGQKTLGETK